MTQYTTVELHGLLAERYRDQPIEVELIDGLEPAINLTLADQFNSGVLRHGMSCPLVIRRRSAAAVRPQRSSNGRT
ncbi:hypothetical protein [Xanthomonas campestris]|uniref:hypothetical protein n=1 Tax=Xanthomonas campestris TaxID=339 RepID=UPI003CCFF309